MPKSFSKESPLYNSGLVLSSVEQLPNASASAAFTVDSAKVFREDVDMVPVTLSGGIQYMPWGADNQMPYHVLDMIEKDETLSTCQIFNAEVCYGNGLQYNTENCTATVRNEVEVIPPLSMECPWQDLQDRLKRNTHLRKFAVVSRVPTPDSTYYPIPYYASLFRGKWYNIKQLIGMAKEAKLKNSAPTRHSVMSDEGYSL